MVHIPAVSIIDPTAGLNSTGGVQYHVCICRLISDTSSHASAPIIFRCGIVKILLLAPHPFYQDRGTPIAVDLLLRTLSARGDDVDVLTYHEGSDRAYEGPGRVNIVRIRKPPGCRNIRPGFSLKKLIADVYMHREAKRLVRLHRYDLVHAVEESVFMAGRIRKRSGIPYVFDMDSSMPEQIVEKMPFFAFMLPVMRVFERAAIRNSAAVAAVCDSLAELADRNGSPRTAILRDVPLLDQHDAGQPGRGFRNELNLSGICLLYVGNLESYQGIDLMLQGFARVPQDAHAHLVIVGGVPAHVEKYRRMADELGLAGKAHIIGPRPLSDMSALMAEADILVSPRIKGTNTPMKIYSYMAAGKAILATDLFTHTQVLDPSTACLAPPSVDAFAQAMRDLIGDPGRREQWGRAAAHAVRTRYSMDVYRRTLNELYDGLSGKKRSV